MSRKQRQTVDNVVVKLPVYDIIILADKHKNVGSCTIESSLKETCPCCLQENCLFDCDVSQMEDSPETEDEARERVEKNRVYDGIESMILACYCAEINVTTPEFLESIETAVDAVGNNV